MGNCFPGRLTHPFPKNGDLEDIFDHLASILNRLLIAPFTTLKNAD